MQQYKGKKVAILGLSVEGQDAVKFFVQQHSEILCCDRRTRQALGSIYAKLARYPVAFQLGQNYLHHLGNFDVYVRTPGMSPRLPQLRQLINSGKSLTSVTQLFFRHCRAPIIGVTGTKGKGTTSTLIARMLNESGKRIFLGGNVGTPLLSQVDKIRESDWVILELSSFQLEDMTQSPHIAVVLRITQDHLANYDKLATNFHLSVEDYREAKKSIVLHQKQSDYVVINADDRVSRAFAKLTPATCFSFSRSSDTADAFVFNQTVWLRWQGKTVKLCAANEIKLRGLHNLENIAAAALAATIAGATVPAIRKVALNFEGLEHRLEYVRTAAGVSYFNDSFSTIPETTVAAIQSFAEPIVLIVGGSEKGSDFTQLGQEITHSPVKAVIVIGQMAERIKSALNQSGYTGELIVGCRTMHEIVKQATQTAQKGDVVLLSPACASFDMFANYKDRGRQFKHEVSLLSAV